MDWGEVNPVHAYYNGSCSSKDNEVQAGVQVSRPGGLRRHLQLWKTLYVLYLYLIGTFKLMGIGIPQEDVLSAAESIGCSIFNVPFNVLGVKVGDIMLRRSAWEDIIGKLSSRLSKWKLKALSIGGRLTLIKSVLTSLPLYHMSIFKCPMGVLKLMESIRRNFFNGVVNSEKKLSLIGWKNILASKKIKDLVFQVSLLLTALFFSNGYGVLSLKTLLYGLDSLRSSMVRKLLLIIQVLYLLAALPVGNGEGTSFWEDCWVSDLPLSHLYPRMFMLELEKHVTVATKLKDSSLCLSFRRAPRSGIEADQFRLLSDSVAHVILPQINDRWVSICLFLGVLIDVILKWIGTLG
ncbi:hypothetical protein Tco_1398598 [Tanacetum coccineum]